MSRSATGKQPLGQGLSALLGPVNTNFQGALTEARRVPISQVMPGPWQPREVFDEESLEALVTSIRAKGILQPILVRQKGDSHFEIIAGERRWRAGKKVGLKEVPVIIHNLSDKEALETALVENIQRHDLTPLEEAKGYRRLMDEFHYTQVQLAKIIGKSRPHIANMLRMLNLPHTIQSMIHTGQLSASHARSLITAENPEKLLKQIQTGALTVRDIEAIRRRKRPKAIQDILLQQNQDINEIEETLSRLLSLPVKLSVKGEGGALKIKYQSMNDLDHLISKLSRSSP